MKKPKVLFICTENKARSQMAEAFLRKHAGDKFEVYSAGLEPAPIHPHVYRVMEEVGLDLEGHYPKGGRRVPERDVLRHPHHRLRQGGGTMPNLSRTRRAALLAPRRCGEI